MRFHCLQHVPFETPGILADRLRARGHSVQVTPASFALPSLEDFDGLIIMGGPMSIHDEAEFPWLRAEKELIGAAIRAEKKVLGICLGAQLIAAVSDARVYNNEQKEIGYFPLSWTEAAFQWTATAEPSAQVATEWTASSLRELETVPVFHWHGETFDLPKGAVLLASTKACINQAFLVGENILALQFHPEVTPSIIGDMIAHEGHELIPAPYVQTAEVIMAQLPMADRANPGHPWPLDGSRLLDCCLDAFLHPITV